MSNNEESHTGERAAVAGELIGDRRNNAGERRKLTFGTILSSCLRPRRRGDRRRDDEYHVDWHEPELLFLAVSTVLLSVLDALLTLTLLRHGGHEVNPFLAYVLTYHPTLFAVVKMSLTSGGVLILVAMARAHVFRVIRAKTILQWCLLVYLLLIFYELWLLRGIT